MPKDRPVQFRKAEYYVVKFLRYQFQGARIVNVTVEDMNIPTAFRLPDYLLKRDYLAVSDFLFCFCFELLKIIIMEIPHV
jgi:hypothetical protein